MPNLFLEVHNTFLESLLVAASQEIVEHITPIKVTSLILILCFVDK